MISEKGGDERMPVNLIDFSNDKYLVLKAMYDHQVQLGTDTYVPFSQAEIAKAAGFAKQKTNQLMQELASEGYIAFYNGVRGKYVITGDGLYVIKVFEGSKGGPDVSN